MATGSYLNTRVLSPRTLRPCKRFDDCSPYFSTRVGERVRVRCASRSTHACSRSFSMASKDRNGTLRQMVKLLTPDDRGPPRGRGWRAEVLYLFHNVILHRIMSHEAALQWSLTSKSCANLNFDYVPVNLGTKWINCLPLWPSKSGVKCSLFRPYLCTLSHPAMTNDFTVKLLC